VCPDAIIYVIGIIGFLKHLHGMLGTNRQRLRQPAPIPPKFLSVLSLNFARLNLTLEPPDKGSPAYADFGGQIIIGFSV